MALYLSLVHSVYKAAVLLCIQEGFCYDTPKQTWTVDLVSSYLIGVQSFNIYFIYFKSKGREKYLPIRTNFQAWLDEI
jgi:hypothetical protein